MKYFDRDGKTMSIAFSSYTLVKTLQNTNFIVSVALSTYKILVPLRCSCFFGKLTEKQTFRIL